MSEQRAIYTSGEATNNQYRNQDMRCCMTCQHCDKDIYIEFSFHCYLGAPKFLNGTMYEFIAIQEVEWNGICDYYKTEPKHYSAEGK